ncbi:MAG: GNAT family N-acetyltransferase [Cyanobacteria bacterium P01_C01_bin.89]
MSSVAKTIKLKSKFQVTDCSQVQFSDTQTIDLRQLKRLFNSTAFWAKDRSLEDLNKALHHSNPVISAWHGDHLIGFARGTSDWVYRATIWDVVVDTRYQGAGIGRKLIHTLLGHPAIAKVERVYLMTTQQQEFYKRIGFEVNPSTTMLLLNQPAVVTPCAEFATQVVSSTSSTVPVD